MLQAIQIRNTLRLAKDQTDDLRESGRDLKENDEKLNESFNAVAESISRLIANNEEMADDVSKLTGSVYDMMILEQKRTREEQKLADSLKQYGNSVNDKAVMPKNMNIPEEKRNGNDNDSEDPGSRRGTRQSGGRTTDHG